MKSLFMLVISAAISNVIAIRCRCTEGSSNTCNSEYRYCFTHTVGNNTSRGCLRYDNITSSIVCYINFIKCCDTDFCNADSTKIQDAQLPVPSVHLSSNSRGTVTLLINDSAVVRGEIDGYIATAYIPRKGEQITKKLKPDSRIFSIDNLLVNTTYTVQVTSHKGDVISNSSLPITVRTQNAECSYYKRGESKSNNQVVQCKEFGCYSLWTKIGTTTVLLRRGCWNSQPEPKCSSLQNILFCSCKEEKCLMPEQIQV